MPVGELPYVVRRRFGDVTAGPVVLVGSVGLWVVGVLDWTLAVFLVPFGLFLTVALLVSVIRSGDGAGVVFVVDEAGIYFGGVPREHVPWAVVATVVMSRSEARGDHDSGRAFRVRIAVPGDEVGRVRHGDFVPLFDEIGAALDRHAPPHVLVRRDL